MAEKGIRAIDFDLGRLLNAVRQQPPRELRIPVRRPDDLLVFDLLVENLELKTGLSPRFERRNPAGAAYLIVELPPQSFAEEAFPEASNAAAGEKPPKEVSDDESYPKKNVVTATEPVPQLPSSRVRMAGRSRLAFIMPPGTASLPYTLAAVLEAMRTWPLSLDFNALPDVDPGLIGSEGLKPGEWLTTVARSGGWQRTRAGLSAALEAAGARGIDRAIAAAGQRIAERAAGGLAGSARRSLGKVMFETLQGEMEELTRAFPALREGAAHQASLAALSLAASEAIAPAALRAGASLGISELPLIPLLFGPHEPARYVTALELPYRLLLSPIEEARARWMHRDAPVERRGRTELWHTRLTTAEDDFGPDGPAKVRALWSPDYPQTQNLFPLLDPPKPFRASLDPLDRRMLVQLMAGYDETYRLFAGGRTRRYTPRASQAKRLHLSSLGGLLDAEGNWSPRPTGVDLEQWRHLAALGRDHYVRVVYAGFLCPLGHAASLVKVTERKFESLDSDPRAPRKRVAVLRQRFFIVCRERIRHYPGKGHVFEGRNFPFRQVEVLTRVTPELLPPGEAGTLSELKAAGSEVIFGNVTYEGETITIAPRMAFWPVVPSATGAKGEDFRFEIAATDILGQRVCFSMPLLFVGEVVNFTKSVQVRNAYNAASAARRRANLGSCTVCYAPFDPLAKGDPRLPTSSMTFEAGALNTAERVMEPNFHPETGEASAGIPALQKMLGRNDAVVDVRYPDVYKDSGFGGGNAGQVFLQLTGQPYRLEFGDAGKAKSDALGALAAPQMSILGLSRTMGPVAAKEPANPADPAQVKTALAKVIGNSFDPADFFKGATILGGVELAKILATVTGLEKDAVPKLLSRELPDRIEASFEWDTPVEKPDPLKLLIPHADPVKSPTRLVMKSLVTTPFADPGAATYEAHAELNNFKVNLFGFIILWFERLRFDVRQGRKPDVAVDLRQGSDAVQFGGPLEFVNTLRELIPSNGFSDPPSLAVTPSGISASYTLNLPSVQVGVFALSNASLGAGFNLPFDSRPASVQFRFSERQHPFSLTVSLLGGGGFFAIGVSARGVQEVEAALEFGAAVAIDLGVASGGVEVKAGVYFHWLEKVPDKGTVELAGYVRIHGELSVLGIISVSLTFNLQLGYLKEPGRSTVWGEATLVIEIEVLFFSADVSVRCRREFGGSASDPKFIDLVPDAATWADYCEAFAEEAA
jgi:hypothetical protein